MHVCLHQTASIVPTVPTSHVECPACSAANGFTQKMYNWNTLNAKVLSKLGFQLAKNDIEGVSRSAPLAAECVLNCLRLKLGDAAKGGATTVCPLSLPACNFN